MNHILWIIIIPLKFIGSYECICDKGFEKNPENDVCIDINECNINSTATKTENICNDPYECSNTIGSFECICSAGLFQVLSGRYAGECLDINECMNEENICEDHECINTLGSYYCKCYDGFEFDPTSPKRRRVWLIVSCLIWYKHITYMI